MDCWSHHSAIQSCAWAALEKHDGTADWWLLLTTADRAGTPDVCSQRADLQLFFYSTPHPWEGEKDVPDRWYSCLVQDLRGVCVRNMDSSTDMCGIFIYLSVFFRSITVPKGEAGMDTVLIPAEPVWQQASAALKCPLKRHFQLSYCSMKINGTTFNTVTSSVSHTLSISLLLLPSGV